MESLKTFVDSKQFLIAAHRGASGSAPENTIAAFRLAIEEGANMIETDLQYTDDGQFVAYHDMKHLKKKNNIKNIDFNSWDKLKSLDAGSWFHTKFKGERIPLLREILEFASDKAYLNLELKSDVKPLQAQQIEKMINIIYYYSFEEHLMFSSFDYQLLKLVKGIDSKIHTAAIKLPGQKILPSQISMETDVDAFICSVTELNDKIVKDSKDSKTFLAVYGVDDEHNLNIALKYNITAIGTNFPGTIIKYLENHQSDK